MQSWFDEYTARRCEMVPAAFRHPKRGDEIYQITADPFEIKNLANASSHAAHLTSMRAALRAEMLAIRDTGFMPEGMFKQLAGTTKPSMITPAALADPHSIIRYWAATGCLILKEKASPAKARLQLLLTDPSADVRVVAAECIAYLNSIAVSSH